MDGSILRPLRVCPNNPWHHSQYEVQCIFYTHIFTVYGTIFTLLISQYLNVLLIPQVYVLRVELGKMIKIHRRMFMHVLLYSNQERPLIGRSLSTRGRQKLQVRYVKIRTFCRTG